jgi:TonB-dependent starch-binding outer membrane protein SusC
MKYLIKLIIFSYLIFFGSLISIAAQPELIDVEGYVINEDGAPIKDALIYSQEGRYFSRTDSEGKYIIKAKEDGELLVEAEGYRTTFFLIAEIEQQPLVLTKVPFLGDEKEIFLVPFGYQNMRQSISAIDNIKHLILKKLMLHRV